MKKLANEVLVATIPGLSISNGINSDALLCKWLQELFLLRKSYW